MKTTFLIFFGFITLTINAQVGINTTTPDNSSMLDINSNDKGILLPRLTTVERDAIVWPATSLLIFNTTSNRYEYNSGSPTVPVWVIINSSNPSVSSDAGNHISTGTDGGAYLTSTVYMGKFIISATGNITISSLPFQPSQIKFTAYANVETYDLNSDNGTNNNDPGISNSFASMSGFATNYSNIINQQVIALGAHGNSINDIARYASSSHAIGLRYGNQNGNLLGITSATVTSFNTNGFTINVDSYADSIVVLFEAYR